MCALLGGVFLAVTVLAGKASVMDREKLSPYECGFESVGLTRVSFSLRFFLLAVIFLVFDLEVVLLFPCVFRFSVGLDWLFRVSVFGFVLIISVGLLYEWVEGCLD